MKTNHNSLFLFLAVLSAAQLSRAQSVLVATDDAGGGSPAAIATMELYDNGLYWTVFGGNCGGEFGTDPSLATLGFRNPPFPIEHYSVLGCSPVSVGGAVRDDTFAYYTTPNGVQRKPLNATPSDASRLIGLFWNDLAPGAMMTYNGRAYYAYSSPGGQISDSGYFRIEYFDLPGAGGLFEPVTDVSNGSGLPNVGRITKLGVVYRQVTQGEPLAPYGIALTDGGYLLRFFLEQSIPAFRPAAIIATDVTDFAVRREQFVDPNPLRLFYEEDTLYVSVGRSRCPGDPPARLITLDPIFGGTSTVYTSAEGYIQSIGMDANYLFVSAFARQQLGGVFGGCQLTGAGVIRSKLSPAKFFGGGGVDPNWDAIELAAGENLRSDGHYLYFTRNKEIRRIPNNSPPLRHDFAALGLEAVQVVQDLANSVRLVEGKRTIVRAYARVADSSLPQTDWFPTAQLRGFRNGTELPGGPLFPVNGGHVTSSGDYSVLRPDATRSFQFELPPEWVRSGLLTLRFTVNPNLALYESGANPLGNNTVEAANISVVQVQPPCFVFATMHSTTAPNYWPWENADDFARIMERAKSLLPVADIHIEMTTERVSDEHLCIRTCDVLGVPVPCGVICNDPFDFANSDDWNEALEELADYDSFDRNRPGFSHTTYVGAIHPAVKDAAWGGLGERPGSHFMALMSPKELASYNTPWGGRTLAHEFGHNLNRQHVNQKKDGADCGGNRPDEPDPTYPYGGCNFSTTDLTRASTALGFDVITFSPIVPTAAGDLMSYADNRWPSAWTYNAMMDALGTTGPALAKAGKAPAPAPPPGPYLLVRGLVNLSKGTARLKGCYSLPDGLVDAGKVQQSLVAAATQPPHGYSLRKLDAAGTVLEETPLVIVRQDDADPGISVVNQFVTKPDGMAAIQIVKDGLVLVQSTATPNAPVVNGIGAVYNAEGPSLAISIDASDADGDPLRFSVQFSNDDGATWHTLRINEGSLSFVANPRFLPGGSQCRIRVIATDGFNSANATSDPFSMPRHAPEPFIGGVHEGARLPYGTNVALLGFALDAEDGSLPATSLGWNLSGPTPKTAVGNSVPIYDLSPGIYTAVLTAVDADLNTNTNSLSFEILPLMVRDGAAPTVDGDANDAAYANAATVMMPLAPKARIRFTHAAGNLYVAFSDLPYGFIIPARIGLYVDVNGSGETSIQGDDVAFFVDENGVAEQDQGNGGQMKVNLNPSPGFKAVITRGQSGWNAEFRIAENLLGGWNHLVRLGIFDQSSIASFPIDIPIFAWWPASIANPSVWAPAWLGMSPPAPENLPPVAKPDAPPFFDMNGPTTVELNGNASYDPEGAPLTYVWTQVSGPPVTLQNAGTATPDFSYVDTNPATFRFALVVNDGALDSASVEVAVTLQPSTQQGVALPPAATRQDDGSVVVALEWPGLAGDVVLIQASSNLVDWENIATNTVGALPVVLFTDSQAGTYPHRFYRLADVSPAAPGSAGTALQLDGLDDFVNVPHAPDLDAFPLTVTAWVKTSRNSSAVDGIVSKYIESSLDGYSLFLNNGHLRAWYFKNTANFVWDGALGVDGGFIADDNWHHVAFVVDAAAGRLFVDGIQTGSLNWFGSAGAPSTLADFQIGRYWTYNNAFAGAVDEVTVWNLALAPADLGALMQFTPTGAETGLIGYWPFNEGGGDVAGDATGLGHNGELLNGPVWIPSDAPVFP